MGDFVINTHDFEKAKNQLKKFAEQTPQDLELSKVDMDGGFLGLGDHKVTGAELNDLTTQIQNYLIEFNNLHIKFLQEFGQVYNTFDILDKDYIQSIIIAIKAAEKANNDIKLAQNDITKTIEIQKQTILALKQFKQKVEGYKHLKDIDKLWNDYEKLQNNIDIVFNNISKIFEITKENGAKIKELQEFKKQLENINHLKNIDELWDYTLKNNNEITSIKNDIENVQAIVNSYKQIMRQLGEFKDSLAGYEHLKDIDDLWNKLENIGDKISSIDRETSKIDFLCNDILRFHIPVIENNIDIHKSQINSLQHTLQEIQIQNEETNKGLSKKIKIAYILAGSSIGIAIIEFIFIIMRII